MNQSTCIYQDMAARTQNSVYIGVVGPVRTGKSTFIKRFMETQVIPHIDNAYRRDRAVDELPQSGSGRKMCIRDSLHSAHPRPGPRGQSPVPADQVPVPGVRLCDSHLLSA